MALVDRTSDQISQISTRLQKAANFSSALSLLNEAYSLETEHRKGVEQVNRLIRGWVFVPPS